MTSPRYLVPDGTYMADSAAHVFTGLFPACKLNKSATIQMSDELDLRREQAAAGR